MKIAIFSDIHDHIWNLEAALGAIQGCEALVVCGDLCSPFIIDQLANGFAARPIHIVFGNNDGDLFRMSRRAAQFPQVQLHGEWFQGELGGLRWAANHFNDLGLELAHSGRYDVVCCGHNHCFQVQPLGDSLLINPGTLMGYSPITKSEVPPTFVVYDSAAHSWQSYQVSRLKASEGERVLPYPA